MPKFSNPRENDDNASMPQTLCSSSGAPSLGESLSFLDSSAPLMSYKRRENKFERTHFAKVSTSNSWLFLLLLELFLLDEPSENRG